MMADLNKVLKGLECCQNGFVCGEGCPYREVCFNGEYAFTHLAKDALELLKAQPQIVRCKDCKKYEADKYNPGFGDCFGSCDSLPGVEENFFCADGEPKDE